ncbi:hypothetical protein J6590_050875 [Homalodisca vitripennis]|nr:hypothetical protein J6590_050875 [Homalodisca vitripennis]
MPAAAKKVVSSAYKIDLTGYEIFDEANRQGCYRSGKSGKSGKSQGKKSRTGNQGKVRESGLKSGKSQGISTSPPTTTVELCHLERNNSKRSNCSKKTVGLPSGDLYTETTIKLNLSMNIPETSKCISSHRKPKSSSLALEVRSFLTNIREPPLLNFERQKELIRE